MLKLHLKYFMSTLTASVLKLSLGGTSKFHDREDLSEKVIYGTFSTIRLKGLLKI